MRNEYPRPEFIRKNTRLLNGEWQFEIADKNPKAFAHYMSEPLDSTINVPFPAVSELSGINVKDELISVWYKRTFNVSKAELNGNVILNFGAVDYRAEIYITANS